MAENRFNPRKLLNSKWTAVKPQQREKHFLVTELEFDEQGQLVHCLIEAVISKRSSAIDWNELKDSEKWQQGWK